MFLLGVPFEVGHGLGSPQANFDFDALLCLHAMLAVDHGLGSCEVDSHLVSAKYHPAVESRSELFEFVMFEGL